jgi:hypothetical protein
MVSISCAERDDLSATGKHVAQAEAARAYPMPSTTSCAGLGGRADERPCCRSSRKALVRSRDATTKQSW